MKVIITGATGLLGSNLVKYYMTQSNTKVVAISRSRDKLEKCFAQYSDNANFEYVVQDFSENFDLIDIASNKFSEVPDIIYHAVGSAEGDVIKNYPTAIIKPNVCGLINVFDSLVKNQCKKSRVVVFSSVTIYGSSDGGDSIVSEESSSMSDVLENRNAPYYESKRMLEVITNAYIREFGINAVIVRPSTIYGYSKITTNSAFFSFIKSAIDNKDIVLNKAGLPKRDNLYIDDFVNGMVLLAEKGKSGEVFNVSSGGNKGNFASVDEIAEMIARIANTCFNRNIKVLYREGNQLKRASGLMLECKKLESLGWQVLTSLEDGIKKTIEEYIN